MTPLDRVSRALTPRRTVVELMRRVVALQRRHDGRSARKRRMPKWLRNEQPAQMH
ncbi:type VI secretion system baseplate subunit TssG, partial [Burkholderia pseudomallei]